MQCVFKTFPIHSYMYINYLLRVLLSLRPSQIDVDAQDDDGWTPLHAAIYWGNMGVAEELVLSGADVNLKTNLVRAAA